MARVDRRQRVTETLYRLLPELEGAGLIEADAIEREATLDSLSGEPSATAGKEAIQAVVEQGPGAKLTEQQTFAAEAIISKEGRPALTIQEGRFKAPPAAWLVLEQYRPVIEQRLASVGRIELTSHPEIPFVGTAFQVSEDVLMTNRHVAEAIGEAGSEGTWHFFRGVEPRIDYRAELPPATPAEHPIVDIVSVHAAENSDLALVRIKPTDDLESPPPLQIAAQYEVSPDATIYVIGHPAFDADAPLEQQKIQRTVFEDIFDVKRVAPGKLLGYEQDWLAYDSSTLGGNSGSCVIDLDSGAVVGLHFGGTYMKANYAVALWKLRDDPVFNGVDLTFV